MPTFESHIPIVWSVLFGSVQAVSNANAVEDASGTSKIGADGVRELDLAQGHQKVTNSNQNVTETRCKTELVWFTIAVEFQKPLWQHSKRASLGAM